MQSKRAGKEYTSGMSAGERAKTRQQRGGSKRNAQGETVTIVYDAFVERWSGDRSWSMGGSRDRES